MLDIQNQTSCISYLVQNHNYKNRDQLSALKPTISHKHKKRNDNFDSGVVTLNCQEQAGRFNVLASMFHSIHMVQRAVSSFFASSPSVFEATDSREKQL